MKEIIYNQNNLKDYEMTDFVTKVKLMLINDNNEILLAYQNNNYEFIGGTCEKDEKLIETVNRELAEEIGVTTNYTDLSPIILSKGYYKDWPAEGKNKLVTINYYLIPFNLKPDYNKMNLTENEKKSGFTVKYINMDNIEEIITKNAELYGDKKGITKEMLNVIKLYRDEIKKYK